MFKTKKMGRVAIALFALVVSLIMTVTATYAWFTFSGVNTVNSLDLTVGSGSDVVEINMDQTANWKTAAFYTNLDQTAVNTAVTYVVNAVESGKTYSDFRLGAYTTTDGSAYTNDKGDSKTVNTVDIENGSVLSLKINFRATSAVEIGLSNNSKVSTRNALGSNFVSAWKTIDANTYGTAHSALALNDKIYLSAAYAARFSFAGTSTLFWNPETTGSINDLLTSQQNYYVFNDNAVGENAGAPTNNFAHDYRKQVLGQFPTIYKTSYTEIASLSTAVSLISALTLDSGYYYGQLTLNVWLEGCDTSCVNSILKDGFSTVLEFVTIAA